MSKKEESHTHKYLRIEYSSGYTVFRCVLPTCTHFLPAQLLAGREAICWRCGHTFIVLPKHLILKKVHCEDCIRERKGAKKLKEFRNLILGE